MAKSIRTGDLLERIRAELDERMSELLPHVEEHRQLLAAAASLEIDGKASTRGRSSSPSAARAAEPRKAPARRAAAPKKEATKARRAAKPRRASAAKASTDKPRAVQNATQQAIEAALEHGSHTLSELVLVTAIEAAPIRAQLRRLQKASVVSKVSREGKTAYSLLSAAAAASLGPRKGASAK